MNNYKTIKDAQIAQDTIDSILAVIEDEDAASVYHTFDDAVKFLKELSELHYDRLRTMEVEAEI